MPLLQRLLDLGATLIDYERIADEQNRRLIFFSLHAGYAGMIETLVALGPAPGAPRPPDPARRSASHAHEYADSGGGQGGICGRSASASRTRAWATTGRR